MALNPNAAEFVPQSKRSTASHFCFPEDWQHYSADPAFEESVTSEELEELEAVEEWVALQAELDEMEREHLIATALSEAEPSQILEVEMRALAVESSGSGKRKQDGHKRKGKQ